VRNFTRGHVVLVLSVSIEDACRLGERLMAAVDEVAAER
jgi:hypothetical protein